MLTLSDLSNAAPRFSSSLRMSSVWSVGVPWSSSEKTSRLPAGSTPKASLIFWSRNCNEPAGSFCTCTSASENWSANASRSLMLTLTSGIGSFITPAAASN